MQWIILNFGMITFRLTWRLDFLHNCVTLCCVIQFWHLSVFWLLLWDVTATMCHWLRNLKLFQARAYCGLCTLGTPAVACRQFWYFSVLWIWSQYISIGNGFSCARRGSSTIIMRCAEPRLADSQYFLFSGSFVQWWFSSFSRKHVFENFGTDQENLVALTLLDLFALLVVLLHVKHIFGPHKVEFMQTNC